jgi:hypothetical protein
MKKYVGSTGLALTIFATLSASLFSTSVRADDFPLVITEGLHPKGKGFEESVSKVGENFNAQEKKMFYTVERDCVSAQVATLKSVLGNQKIDQVTIYLKNEKEGHSGKYAEVKTVKDCKLGNMLCFGEKKLLEVGGIVEYHNGLPGGCSVVDVTAIQKAVHRPDVYVSDNQASHSNLSGDKVRAPASYTGGGKAAGSAHSSNSSAE